MVIPMKKYILAPLAIIAALVVLRWSCYTVDAAEYAYVTVLGQHRSTFDGADRINGAGLKFGFPWPVQQVQRLDRRLQQFDLPELEQLTHDPVGNTIDQMLVLQAYACWRIPDAEAVDAFVKSIGSIEQAKPILTRSINSKLGAIVGQKRMNDLVNTSTDPISGKKRVDVTNEEIREILVAEVGKEVRAYGIELIDIRLRRFNHPVNVRGSIYDRIRTERRRAAARYESEGTREASDIVAKAEAAVRENLANAKAEEAKIKAAADIEANKIRNDAYGQDRQFYEFLKSMEQLQSIVGSERTMLLLSTHRPLFERLFTPPLDKKKGDK
jgi:membrane protease subunit HflC